MEQNFEIRYSDEKRKQVRNIVMVSGAAALITLLLLIFLPGEWKAVISLAFILSAGGALGMLVKLRQVNKWCFQVNGPQVCYRKSNGKEIRFFTYECSAVHIFPNSVVTVSGRGGEQLFRENLTVIPDAVKILCYFKEQNVNFFYAPGAEELQREIENKIFVTRIYEETGELRMPWQDQTVSYVQEPYAEKREAEQQKEVRKQIAAVLLSTALFILLMALVATMDSPYRLLVLAGYIFLMGAISPLLLRANIKLETRIRKEGRLVNAIVRDFHTGPKGEKFPVFEFALEDGLHLCMGRTSDKRINAGNQNSYLNQTCQVFYAPELSDMVSYADEKEYRKLKKNVWKGFVPMGAFAVIMAAAGVIIIAAEGPNNVSADDNYKDAGTGLLIEYSEEYVPDDFTQDDIDSDTVQWICAAYNLYSVSNSLELDRVGGVDGPDDWRVEPLKESLDSGWGITDRESAIEEVGWLLEEGGHRASYHAYVDKMKEEGWLDLDNTELAAILEEDGTDSDIIEKYLAAKEAWQAYGDAGIDAWDYCRALQVLGSSYACGYINLEECLDQSLPVAQLLQSEFQDWESLYHSYLYGYCFWSKSRPGEIGSAAYYRYQSYDEIRKMDDAPCKSLDFDMLLEDTWSGQKKNLAK